MRGMKPHEILYAETPFEALIEDIVDDVLRAASQTEGYSVSCDRAVAFAMPKSSNFTEPS